MDAGRWTYEYDAAGNLTHRTDPRGTIAQYRYDGRNLPVEVTFSNAEEGVSHTCTYVHDEAGATVEAHDGSVVTRYNSDGGSYSPDPYGLVWSEETNDDYYSYDRLGRLMSAMVIRIFRDGRARAAGSIVRPETVAGSTALRVNREDVTVVAVTDGRNEYEYYPDSDLIRTAGDTAYRYDENGNLVEEGTTWNDDGGEVVMTNETGRVVWSGDVTAHPGATSNESGDCVAAVSVIRLFREVPPDAVNPSHDEFLWITGTEELQALVDRIPPGERETIDEKIGLAERMQNLGSAGFYGSAVVSSSSVEFGCSDLRDFQ